MNMTILTCSTFIAGLTLHSLQTPLWHETNLKIFYVEMLFFYFARMNGIISSASFSGQTTAIMPTIPPRLPKNIAKYFLLR